MLRRVIAASVMLPFVLTGCAHNDSFAQQGMFARQDAGFGETVVVAEGGAESSVTPVPVAWGTTEVSVGHVRGPRAVAEEDGPYLLDTGDKLRIFVYGQPSLSRLYTVDHDGKIIGAPHRPRPGPRPDDRRASKARSRPASARST